ncbi:MAG: class I SAM-dependent methyltransferase [Myxococcales bacterium]|nr:class I SAM-dependent methyltransferase [Myxococcales bacterium]MCB9714549.1 class I SAM-dependent methyltransferase [Myxococcales bacterium]
MSSNIEYWTKKYSKDNYAWGQEPSDVAARVDEYLGSGRSALDIGCGCGRDALYFARKGSAAVGIDFCEEGIRQARELKEKDGIQGSLEYQVADFRHLSDYFPKASFDLICSYNSFHLLREVDRKAAFQQMIDLLKPGGVLAFEVFSTKEGGYGDGEEIERGTFVKKTQIVHFYDDVEIRELTSPLEVIQLEHVTPFEDYPNDHRHQEWLYIGRKK